MVCSQTCHCMHESDHDVAKPCCVRPQLCNNIMYIALAGIIYYSIIMEYIAHAGGSFDVRHR